MDEVAFSRLWRVPGRCRAGVLSALVLVACGAEALAQTVPAARPRIIIEGSGATSKDPIGRPCLDVETIARARVVNPNAFDHIISIENKCLKPIKVQVCVYRTEQCTVLDVAGMKRKDAVLGTGQGSQIVRYSYTERR